MIAVTRFRVPTDVEAFAAHLQQAAEHYATCAGNLSAEAVQSLDEPDLWALVSRWKDVGSYRRAFSGYDAKMLLTPLMVQAISEPGAFNAPDEVGFNVPRGHD